MAKKNTQPEVVAESKWDGRLLTLIGTSILQFLAIALMIGIGAGIAFALGAFNAEADATMAIVGYVVMAVFAMIGICWADIIFIKWDTKHTVISGQRLKFKAGALNLFFNIIKWTFLTVITLGIYSFWLWIKVRKWMVKHTVSFPEETEEEGNVVEPQITYYTVED